MPNIPSTNSSPAHRILLVEPVSQAKTSFAEKLARQNLAPYSVRTSTHGIVATIEQSQPDILIFSVDALDKEALQNLILIKQNAALPVAIFAKHHSPSVVQSVVNAGVSSYVVDDVIPQRIPVIIDLALARFAQDHKIHLELAQTKAKLFERKVIEKAKGIIMLQKKVSEDQAYAELRRSAMNQGRPMADLAKSVISVFDQRA